jgi:hypothetical protein
MRNSKHNKIKPVMDETKVGRLTAYMLRFLCGHCGSELRFQEIGRVSEQGEHEVSLIGPL